MATTQLDTITDYLSEEADLRVTGTEVVKHLAPLAIKETVKQAMVGAELPPEEYFELINQIWGAIEPMLRKYYATHGKHVGDGMVYYFFP